MLGDINKSDESYITTYQRNIQNRSKIHYFVGLIIRWKHHLKYARICRIARKRGASIGENVTMPMSLAKKINHNVTIGNNVCIATDNFSSFRYPIKIGNNVIVGSGVKFVMGGHRIDSVDWEHYRPNKGLVIEDYVWLCPDSVILPSVQKVGYGAVVGANAVAVKDVEPMSVMGGNPAKEIKKRVCVHTDLVVESLLGGDFKAYKAARCKSNE